MKTIIIAIFTIITLSAFAQQKSYSPSGNKKLRFLGKTDELRNKPPIIDSNYIERKTLNEDPFTKSTQKEIIKKKDNVTQTNFTKDESIISIQNFAGVGAIGQVSNPDTQGDVGMDHYFQMVKRSFAIWDKQGNILYGPAENKTIWNDFPGPWLEYEWTDPIVLYDYLNDRWLVSCMVLDIYNEYFEMIAVSVSPDPLGEWYCYALSFDQNLPDYPKFGIWPDGYYLTANEWLITTTAFTFKGPSILVFNPDELINGNPEPTVIYFHIDSQYGSTTHDLSGFQPSDLDGDIPPPGTPNYLICMKDDAWGYPEDRLWLWECQVDWSDTSNCYFNEVDVLEVEPFNTTSIDYIHQPGTSTRLQSLNYFMMYRLQYRNFGEYQTLVCNHTVKVDGSDLAAVRWYELRDEGEGWYINQQSTLAPDENSRWMGSIAKDADGNTGLGYSVSGDNTYPSIRATGQLYFENNNLMTFSETEFLTGTASQTNNNRWGDYSTLSVDPEDGLTFWYTQEYIDTTGSYNWKTRITSFQLHKNLTASTDTLEFLSVEECINGKQLILKNNSLYDVEVISLEQEGFVGIYAWWAETPGYTFPMVMAPGDSMMLQVYVDVQENENIMEIFTDTLNVLTDYKNHSVILMLNDSILTHTQNNFTEDQNLRIFPNPFNGSTQIAFKIERKGNVDLTIYDLENKPVKVILKREKLKSGTHSYVWDGRNGQNQKINPGVYLLRLQVGNQTRTYKIIKH